MKLPMLDLARLHAPLKDELVAVFEEAVRTGQFIGGPAVERFEEALARHVGARHGIGVSSGTDALLAGLMALGVGPGDEVITSPYTFFATAGCIARLGARPVFCDIDAGTFNIDPAKIAKRVTARTVGIVPVHLFGQCADMAPILDLAAKRGLWVLEDAAQAIGALYRGQGAGTMGALGAFSFFPAKNLGAMGDGGAIVTNDDALAARLKELRNHGSKRKYYYDRIGGNFRLDALQAAMLSVKLPRLSAWEDGRRAAAARYDALLGRIPGVSVPRELPGRRHVYNQYVLRLPRRDAVRKALEEASIETAIYYPLPLHLQGCFSDLGYGAGHFPSSEAASADSLAVPIDPLIDENAQTKVARIIEEVLR